MLWCSLPGERSYPFTALVYISSALGKSFSPAPYVTVVFKSAYYAYYGEICLESSPASLRLVPLFKNGDQALHRIGFQRRIVHGKKSFSYGVKSWCRKKRCHSMRNSRLNLQFILRCALCYFQSASWHSLKQQRKIITCHRVCPRIRVWGNVWGYKDGVKMRVRVSTLSLALTSS